MHTIKILCPNCKSKQSAHSKRCKKCNCRLDAVSSHYGKHSISKAKSSSGQIILDGKFCSSCSTKIAKEAKHCPKCGQPFVSSSNHIESYDDGFWFFLLVFFILLIIINY